MLSLEDYLLLKIAEEGSEIQKVALKAIQHGLDDHHPNEPTDNLTALMREYSDLNVYIEELAGALTEEQEARLDQEPWEHYVSERRYKALRWLKKAVDKGRVDPEDKHVKRLLEELSEK